MLPTAHRLRDGAEFRRATREGRRARSRTLVLHLTDGSGATTRVGLIVSRAVGGAVVRNRVKRRLRHLVAAHLSALPEGSVLVVRALPAAGTAGAGAMGEDFADALHRLLSGAPTTKTVP